MAFNSNDDVDGESPNGVPSTTTAASIASSHRSGPRPCGGARGKAGRPKSDACLCWDCGSSKVKGSPCCADHKPDYQNLYNDAKRQGAIADFHTQRCRQTRAGA